MRAPYLVFARLGSVRLRHEAAANGLLPACKASVSENATIEETTALIGELDLVVTVDTMVAHLAGG